MITNQEQRVLRKMFERIHRKMLDELPAELDKVPPGVTVAKDIDKILASQNMLRSCMEVAFNMSLPYSERFVLEMAMRLATYAVSAAPIERHADMVEVVCASLPAYMGERVKSGAVIKSEWVTDGVAHPNIPDKGEVH